METGDRKNNRFRRLILPHAQKERRLL